MPNPHDPNKPPHKPASGTGTGTGTGSEKGAGGGKSTGTGKGSGGGATPQGSDKPPQKNALPAAAAVPAMTTLH